MATEKLRRLSRITDSKEMDTLEARRGRSERTVALDVLAEAQMAWNNMDKFRRERERNKRYTYGKQWDDIIEADGRRISEENYIRSQGNVPLKNNIIRKLVRSILGVYRSQSKEPTCVARDRDEQKLGDTMSTVLQYNMQLNRMNDVYARSMEEFLISGLVVHRKSFGWRNDKLDCWTDYVQPNNFFVDCNMRDFRGWDCSLVGEVHDVSFNDVVREFATNDADYYRLADIYRLARNADYVTKWGDQFGFPKKMAMDFLFDTDGGRCRVIEVWRKESKPRYRCHDYNTGEVYKIDLEDYAVEVENENARRLEQGRSLGMDESDIPLIKAEWFMDDYWYFYYLSPFGDILHEGEVNFKHHSHPYVFMGYPFIDGEIHSFVADVIDQQRYINRLITLNDWIMRASAKGVLLLPEDCIPDGMSVDDFADEWTRFNGVIVIKKGSKNLPQQVANNATNIGVSEMLNLQMKLIEDISGVSGSLQGKPGQSGMSAALYSQQTQNSTITLLDILESFSGFIKECTYKDVKNIQQFYDEKRIFNIAGRGAVVEYDPSKISDVEFDLAIMESTSTPVYRQMANDFLMQIWGAGQISLEQLLSNGDFPFGDKLLQSIQSQKQDIQNGQMPSDMSPELKQQMQQGADMNAVNKAQAMLQP